MDKRLILLVILVISSAYLSAEWNEAVVKEIFSDTFLSADDIYQQLQNFNDFPAFDKKGEVIKMELKDGSPWYYYIPTGYDPLKRHALIVWLHGGVGREEYFEEDEYVFEHPLIAHCQRTDMIWLMPMARNDCMWWRPAGEQHIKDELLYLKQEFNIDDDRIYLAGFSDGGSGAFHYACRLPGDFAAFYPLNGMVNVAAGETGIPCFPSNISSRYLRAVNTDEDGLYPAAQTRLTMQAALDAGANVVYLEYWGIGHDWGYFDEDMPLMIKNTARQVRDVFQPQIYWECAGVDKYNRSDWLEITRLDTLRPKKDWQKEFNVQLPDERISFGFFHDVEYKGEGVLVDRVIPGTLAEDLGLQKGDVIIGMDEGELANIDDLAAAKSEKKRGDPVSLSVFRNKETILLKGQFPEVVYYDAFFYKPASGAVQARYYANIFELETSRVGAVKLYISPEMVNVDIPVRVIINGEEVFNDMVEYDKEIIEDSILSNFDRKAIWIDRLQFDVK